MTITVGWQFTYNVMHACDVLADAMCCAGAGGVKLCTWCNEQLSLLELNPEQSYTHLPSVLQCTCSCR